METTLTPLKQILIAEGRKQAWLARTIGATESEVSDWAKGVHVPVEATRHKIAEALHRDPAELWPHTNGNGS